MEQLQGKKILIFQQRKWGVNIGHYLAKQLNRSGCRLAAFTLKKTTHEFVQKQEDIPYELIANNDEIMSCPKAYLGKDDFTLEAICKNMNIDSIWPIVMSLRNHVRSYKDKFYYGYKQNVDDEDILNYVKALYKCIVYIFEEFSPDVILTPNFVALPHIMFSLYAQACGAHMFAVTDCKVKNVFIFTNNYQDAHGVFYDRVDALNSSTVESTSRERAKKYIRAFREDIQQKDNSKGRNRKTSLLETIKCEVLPWRQVIAWYRHKQKNFLDSTGVTLDFRPPRIILRDHYSRRMYEKRLYAFPFFPFEKVDRFVYFPLQVQPEESIDVKAPFFSNQIETARQIAMALPDDYVLVVKEHPAMVGRRSPSYLEKVSRTPNVKLIDIRVPNVEVLKQADLIVSPNSTTLTEAAFFYKPAIQLGNLGTTLKLPNVTKHTDMTTLSTVIKKLLRVDYKTPDYERRLENYVAAAYDTGFELDYVAAWERGQKDNLELLWQAYEKEIRRLLFQPV